MRLGYMRVWAAMIIWLALVYLTARIARFIAIS